jgi:poly-beta-1,6-N-acetyl-D-glucosamine synthase
MLLEPWMSLLNGSAVTALSILGIAHVVVILAQIHVMFVRRNGARPEENPSIWPPISILVPAYNEERVIVATIHALLRADYPSKQIIVIDDGSTDGTARIVAEVAACESQVKLICKPINAGKANALNVGIAQATAEHLVVVDADTIVDANLLKRIVAPLLIGQADAVAGNVKVGNRERGLLLSLQSIEYISALNTLRAVQGIGKVVTTIPGAAGAMRRATIRSVGEYSACTRAEDAELTLRLVNSGSRILFQPTAVAHTEAPGTLRTLFRQRLRWMYGNLQCIYVKRAPSASARSWLSSATFAYENLLRPPLECFRAILPVVLIGSRAYVPLMISYLVLLALSGGLALLSYRMDRERLHELLYYPIYYTLWPVLLIVPYCAAVFLLLCNRSIAWNKATRTASVALVPPAGVTHDQAD